MKTQNIDDIPRQSALRFKQVKNHLLEPEKPQLDLLSLKFDKRKKPWIPGA